MVFGELVIPSSRALWDDDQSDFVEYEEKDIEWEKEGVSFNDIRSLYVVDTPTVLKLFETCILPGLKPTNQSKRAGLRLYVLGDDVVVLYENKPEFTSGEIIQKALLSLIENSKNIYGITSSPMALYQGNDISEEVTCFIKTLSTNSKHFESNLPKLQIPNLVTGITANVFSYCVHIQRDCQLFVGYVDAAPLDSVNTKPFIKLFKEIGLEIKSNYSYTSQVPSSNLYM